MKMIRTPVSLKVPARIAAIFWAIKLFTTALGESTSDYLVHNVNPYAAVVGAFVVFLVAMSLQLRTDRYVPWVYWFRGRDGRRLRDDVRRRPARGVRRSLHRLDDRLRAAPRRGLLELVTNRADAVDPQHHDQSARSVLLGGGSHDVRDGNRRRRSRRLHVRAGLPLGRGRVRRSDHDPRHRVLRLRRQLDLAFWVAYVLTRPLGASFADWTGKARDAGGVGIGDGTTAAVLVALIVAAVVYLTVTRADQLERGKAGYGEALLAEDAA